MEIWLGATKEEKLGVMARIDLAPGDEIVFPYIDMGDYFDRILELKNSWGITCSCNLCPQGPQGPGIGKLRTRAVDLVNSRVFLKDCDQDLTDISCRPVPLSRQLISAV